MIKTKNHLSKLNGKRYTVNKIKYIMQIYNWLWPKDKIIFVAYTSAILWEKLLKFQKAHTYSTQDFTLIDPASITLNYSE